MGLFGKKEAPKAEPEVEEVVVEEAAPAPKYVGTVIAEGMTLEGNFDTDEQMDIKGTVRGNIKSSVDTLVSKTGNHFGKMDVKSLHVEGTLKSDVVCSDLASLSETAVFTGTLKTVNFDAANGSNFEGILNLGKKAEKPAQVEEPAEAPAEE